MTGEMAGDARDSWIVIEELQRAVAARPDDVDVRRRLAAALHAEAVAARSVTRDGDLEITSARQLRICAYAAERILALRLDDDELNTAAAALLDKVRAARRWIWVREVPAALLLVLAVVIGLGAAVAGGLGHNLVLVVTGIAVSSLMLFLTVLRYRRESWRIRADRIAPMIWKPGV